MANHLRTLRGGKVSFFLFMDTITAVTAMLIMVSLIMTLYFGDAPIVSTGGGDPNRTRQILRDIEQINERNRSLRLQLAAVGAAPENDRLTSDIADLRAQLNQQVEHNAQLQARLEQLLAEAQRKANELGVGEENRQIEETNAKIESAQVTNRQAQITLDELGKQSSELEAQLEKARRQRSKLWLIPEADGSGKRPLLVCLSATNMVWERFNQPQSRKEFSSANGERQFNSLLNELKPDRDYFVFYIRPSGISQFQQYSEQAKAAGFNVGFDAVEEDRQVLFNSPEPPL